MDTGLELHDLAAAAPFGKMISFDGNLKKRPRDPFLEVFEPKAFALLDVHLDQRQPATRNQAPTAADGTNAA